jgi:hypothetical protein
MQWRCGAHFVQALIKRGFISIGSGLFSDVLAKPGSDRVVKVYTYGSQGDMGDTDPWPEYVLWAAKNGYAGTHAPRVFSFKIVSGTMGAFYVAVMERLEATLGELRRGGGDPRLSRLTPLTHQYRGAYNKEEAEAVAPGFYDFRRHFREAFLGRCTDLHDGNWMVQGTRLVLTDPLAGGGTSTSKRWRVSRDGALQQLAA